MAISIFPKVLDAAKPDSDPSKGKVFDNPGFEKAAKDAGYTAEEAVNYWKDLSNSDPYSQKNIDAAVSSMAPKISLNDGKISIQAPQVVLESPMVAQIKQELQALKGADLKSPEVVNVIDSLNKEIAANVSNAMIEQSLGWKKDEYEDYQYLLQTISGTNPMRSSNKVKGADKEGNIQMKTPEEWVEYYRSAYNTDERTQAYLDSLQSNSPYKRAMALIMGQGQVSPVYGFDAGEKMGQGVKAMMNQLGKFPEGTFRLLAENNNTTKIEDLVKKTELPREAFRDMSVSSDEQFNAKRDSIKGKTWSELSDADKAFVLEVAVSQENKMIRSGGDRELTKLMAERAGKNVDAKNTDDVYSEDENTSRDAINRVLDSGNFEEYRETRNNYDTWQGYEDWTNEGERELEKTAIWSGAEQMGGNFAGVVGRFLWENAVVKGATGGAVGKGGFSMNSVSDRIGAKIVDSLVKRGISPASRFGQSAMQFTANLIGTVPEDILQTSIDNVLTYNLDDNKALLDPQQMSENFAMNLLFMSLFNAGKAGLNAIRRGKIAKNLAKQAELGTVLDIEGINSDVDDIVRATKKGNQINVTDDTVSIIDDTGKEKVLNNITPEQGRMAQQNLTDTFEQPYKNGTDTKFYSFVEMNSPIEGIKDNFGSLTEWLAAKDIDIDNRSAESIRRFESLPQEIKDIINNEKNIQRMLSHYDHDTAFRRLGSDFPYSRIFLDGSYANYIWKNIDANASAMDNLAKAANDQPTVRVEVDTPEGKMNVETPDYRIRNLDDSLKLKIEPTPASVKHLHNKTLQVLMDSFQQEHLPDFQRRFPGVEASDFDWVFHNTRNGLEPNQIIGTVNPETGREITEQMIKAMEWFGDQPFMKDLRKASRDALGLEGDFNMLGYLPHSTYDPSNLSFDEALTGQLWRQYSGASMTGENGEYKGFGGDFNSRYRTFASNMLWDARSKDVAAAKLMEEAEMDGKTITSEQAVKAVEGQQDIQRKVSESASTKELETALASDTDADEIDFKKIDEATKKQAQNSGLGKAIHDNYSEVYFGANSATVAKQSGATRQAFDTLGNTMRNTQIIDGRGRRMSLYDWGGADFVYAERNAVEIVNRYMREGGDLRDMLIEFIENHSHRTTEYAEAVADRWMKKLGDTPGQLTKAAAIRSLGGSMKWEAMGRIRKFLTMAKYDEFNDATKKTIDSFLFSHMQMDTIKTSQKISKKLAGALNVLTSLRYRALFYGNVKNALLQVSELNRLFTTFKWGDVATMSRRMATDANFKARVDDIYDAVAPQQSSFRNALYNDYADVAGNMETTQKGVSFKESGKKMVEAIDNIGLAPIEAAEAFKNRMMIAALVQEADGLGLTGDDALRHIRNRFERVALAMDELGRIGLTSNPIARTALFLQNFQIRELGMHIYNLSDEWAKGMKLPKKVLNASKYLSKVLGTKLATTLILARLGYSASQTLGYDPFGVLENYTGIDEEDMEGFDYFMKSPLFAGGMTSLLSDMYFMSRKAYEESNPKTVSEEAEEEISGESSWGMAGLSFDELMGLGQAFVPGNVMFNRFSQMNDMLDTGWATSVSGNKMYTAPTDAFNTILGYLFGRSATQNAQQYNQTYGDNLWQTLSRMRPGREFGEFDPIDNKNYSDWFKGDANDLQQFNKGLRYFRSERDRIMDAYEDAVRRGYSADEDAEAKNNMNQQLNELYDKLDRFVDAYENKNGTIDANMTKQIVNVLNTGRKVLGDTEQEAEQRSLQAYNDALGRYSQLGMSPVGTYTGPTTSSPDKEVKYQGSPQYRSAVQGYYGSGEEAVSVLKQADKQLQPIRKELRQQLSNAYDFKDYDKVRELQQQYLAEFDQVVSPIIATYGNGILKDTDVVNQIKDMLSTGTMSRSGDLIPTSQYKKDKYGRYRSMPMETVDVKKWAQQRFGGELYTQPTANSDTTVQEDLTEIRRLINNNQPQRARARALQLKVRVDNQTRSLSQSDYKWLNDFLNGGL